MTAREWKSVLGRGRLSASTGSARRVRRGVVVNGGNEFPSRYMEVLRTGTDDGARVESPFRHGFASQRKALGRGRLSVRRGWVVNGWRADERVMAREGKSVSTRLRPSLRSQRKALGRGSLNGWGTDDGARVEVRFDTASPVNARVWGRGKKG
jgi:hypothetical protein